MKFSKSWLWILLLGFVAAPWVRPAVQNRKTEVVTQLVKNNNLGVALMEQFKFEEAAREFEKNTRIDPSFVPGWVNLGIALFFQNDHQAEATKAFQKALELDPKEIHAHFMMGLIYRNEDRGEALAEFLEVNRQDPTDASANYFVGLQYSRDREYSKAEQYLRRAIERQPYNVSAHYNLAISLLRAGNRDEGQAAMMEFRRLKDQFGSEEFGQKYMEQGRYAYVIELLSPYLGIDTEKIPAIRVSFRETAATAGLSFRHSAAIPTDLRYTSSADLVNRIAPFVGSGLSFGDYDGDGAPDLYLANAASNGAQGALFRNLGNGRFKDVSRASGLVFSGKTMAALWGDYDNDGRLDLYLLNCGPNVLYRNNGDGTFTDATAKAGVGDAGWGVSGAFVDSDHDGDLDIVVANLADIAKAGAGTFPAGLKGAPNIHYRNNGDGTFTQIGAESGLAGGALRTTAIVATDFNNSRDIDFYVVNQGAPNQLMSNRRNGAFIDVAGPSHADNNGQGGVSVGDFNQDGWTDFALPDGEANRSSLLVNQGNESFKAESLASSLAAVGAKSFQGAQFFDYDNDGDLDLLFVGSPLFGSSDGKNLALLENDSGRFKDVTAAVGLSEYSGLQIRAISVSDYDRDGDLDFALSVAGSSPLLFENDGGNRNNWLQIELTGTSTNKAGIGTKVEILAGRHWQKMEVYGGDGFLSQSPAIVHFGLGRLKSVDVVRLLWPGGVLQSELEQAANQRVKIQELDRKGTSCPILYVWNGSGYQFVTDFLGGSAFGYQVAPGVYNYPDTDEYVKLDRQQLALKGGRLALTLNNQLEEVIFYDRLQLVTVDHPAEYEIFPNERLLPGPPYDRFELLSVSRARPPVEARTDGDRDVTNAVSRIDRIYAEGFENLPYKGYAKPHALTLDLGDISGERAVLLLNAWIDYADSTSNIAASQAGISLVPPYLQVQDADGQWVTVVERMGFPAGLPKTMTVDLSGKFLSDSRKVRIVTSMRIYWDQILVESGPARHDYRIARLEASRANLHFRGFPRFYSPDGRQPNIYDYSRISLREQWKAHVGGYTRFGDVRPLLGAIDDQFVITKSGDEVEAEFDLSRLPTLPDGWVRDYLVYVDGYGKDMDINSATPDTVGPLPFHGMRSYPYPEEEGYPDDAVHLEYLRNWNTRLVEEWMPGLSARTPVPAVSFPPAPRPSAASTPGVH